MEKINPQVDLYIQDGCGRCELGGTPDCKVHRWTKELKALRTIILETGLREERKWGVPCYTYQKSNLVIISALKESCVLSFFKGVLLKDPQKILQKPGENSQSDRLIRFTKVKQITQLKSTIKAYIQEAIEAEKAGLKVEFKAKDELTYPDELNILFAEDLEYKEAFERLTPGRQRGYLLHFSQPKQTQTKIARMKKYRQQILAGVGMHDKYKMNKG